MVWFWAVWFMLLSKLAWLLGCEVVVIGQPVLHHHIIVHCSFSVPMG